MERRQPERLHRLSAHPVTKVEARKLVRSRQWDASRDAFLRERFMTLPEVYAAANVMAYVSTAREPDTMPLLQKLLSMGKCLLLPRVSGDGFMEARAVSDLAVLVRGAFGILEPDSTAPLIAPDKIEVVLVPGVAFDLERRRLGRGGGYYDRFLPETHAFTAALAAPVQLLPEVPAESHDVCVDCLITADGIFR